MRRAIGFGVTFLAGALVGTFLAGPIVFADGPMRERLTALGVATVAYVLLGACSGWWLRTRAAGFWLAAPGVAVAVALGEEWLLIGFTIGVLLFSAVAGAWLGAHWRRKR